MKGVSLIPDATLPIVKGISLIVKEVFLIAKKAFTYCEKKGGVYLGQRSNASRSLRSMS